MVLSRSGTTTEVLELLDRVGGRLPTVSICAVSGTPVTARADAAVVLDFADERSVVQTRFATSALVLLRAHVGYDVAPAIADAETACGMDLPEAVLAAEQVTFLGQGWTYGLAQEAALKMREAAGAWTEAYPTMEYRHGPISISGPDRATWLFGKVPAGLLNEVQQTGATPVCSDLDPLADLVRAQRVAVAVAHRRGLDPDRPRHLSRSVILAGA